MAKATKDDIQEMKNFFLVWEELNRENFQITKDEVKENWRHDENMYNLLMPYAVDELNSFDNTEEETKSKFLEDWFSKVSWRKSRVIYGCEILIDSVCDPNKDYLDFKPELANIEYDKAYSRIKGYYQKKQNISLSQIIQEFEMDAADWEQMKKMYDLTFMSKDDIHFMNGRFKVLEFNSSS